MCVSEFADFSGYQVSFVFFHFYGIYILLKDKGDRRKCIKINLIKKVRYSVQILQNKDVNKKILYNNKSNDLSEKSDSNHKSWQLAVNIIIVKAYNVNKP